MWPATPAVHPVLERDLQRLLDRGGAVGREEEVRVVDGHDPRQRLGQLDHDDVAVAEHGGVRAAVELLADGVVELGDAVAEGVDPQRRDGVEVAAAVDVDQLVALAALDDDRRVVGVRVHLGEAVPHDRGVARHPLVVAAHPATPRRRRPRGRGARRGSSPAAASSEPSGGFGSACANDSSDTESNGTTWRWTCGHLVARRSSCRCGAPTAPPSAPGRWSARPGRGARRGSGSRSIQWSTSARGTTSVWPGCIGLIDRNADALRVAPHEDAGDLAVDDAREQRRHAGQASEGRGAGRVSRGRRRTPRPRRPSVRDDEGSGRARPTPPVAPRLRLPGRAWRTR